MDYEEHIKHHAMMAGVEKEKERVMPEGSLNATEIAVGSLLAGGRGGYGGGGYGGYGGGGVWGGGGYGGGHGYGPYASPASNAVRIDRNAQQTEDQADCTRLAMDLGLNGIRDSFENLTRTNDFQATNKNIADSELRMSDRLRDLERIINQNSKDAAACCCETQRLVVEENSKTRELMQGNLLDAANATIAALQAELRSGHHRGG